ncbi:MAG TPA: thioredoxin family protein [Candidatus Faecimonas gallistercoris]|nr:thioredoxin family protein [Candidatus Faecimonas gallistercoris]
MKKKAGNKKNNEKIAMIISICIIVVVIMSLIVIGSRGNSIKRQLVEQTASDIKYDKEKINVYFFWGKGCPHCEELITFLDSLSKEYDSYFDLYTLEVWYNEENNELMNKLVESLDKEVEGIPCLIIGNQVFFGYDQSMEKEIKSTIKKEYQKKTKYDVYKKYKQEA